MIALPDITVHRGPYEQTTNNTTHYHYRSSSTEILQLLRFFPYRNPSTSAALLLPKSLIYSNPLYRNLSPTTIHKHILNYLTTMWLDVLGAMIEDIGASLRRKKSKNTPATAQEIFASLGHQSSVPEKAPSILSLLSLSIRNQAGDSLSQIGQ